VGQAISGNVTPRMNAAIAAKMGFPHFEWTGPRDYVLRAPLRPTNRFVVPRASVGLPPIRRR
jgi:hypothetical protein